MIESVGTFDISAVTASEPAQTDKCSAAFVWGVRVYDSGATFSPRGDDPGCLYRRTLEMAYRVDTCHKIRGDGRELTAAEHLVEATNLYDLGDAVWCAVAAADLTAACQDKSVGPLIYGVVNGDRISFTGTVTVTEDCP